MSWFRWQSADLLLQLKIQPGASRSEFAGMHGEHLKVRIHAPPIDGRANAALIEFLCEAFAVPKAHVDIQRGELGRVKCICIRQPKALPEVLVKLGLAAASNA